MKSNDFTHDCNLLKFLIDKSVKVKKIFNSVHWYLHCELSNLNNSDSVRKYFK